MSSFIRMYIYLRPCKNSLIQASLCILINGKNCYFVLSIIHWKNSLPHKQPRRQRKKKTKIIIGLLWQVNIALHMTQNKCNINITRTIIRDKLPTAKLQIYKINNRAITEKTFIRVNRHAGNAAFVAILVYIYEWNVCPTFLFEHQHWTKYFTQYTIGMSWPI